MTQQNDTQNSDAIKAAAKRMCAVMASKGLNVKHSLMLEALASGFGLDNWRKLKAVIDAPRQAAPRTPVAVTEDFQKWTVHALYLDNQQQYGDYFYGRTPLEAAISAIVERLTDCGLDIGILEVRDSNDMCHLSPSMLDEIRLMSNHRALAMLREELARMGEAETQPSFETGTGLAWLAYVLNQLGDTGCEELTDWSTLESARPEADDPFLLQGTELTPTAVLDLLCKAVEKHHGGVVALESSNEELALALYQVRAICSHFGAILDDAGILGTALIEEEELFDDN